MGPKRLTTPRSWMAGREGTVHVNPIGLAPLLVREQRLLTEVLGEMRKLLPFALLGLDTDNDSVFMNETVRDYCLAAGVEFTHRVATADDLPHLREDPWGGTPRRCGRRLR